MLIYMYSEMGDVLACLLMYLCVCVCRCQLEGLDDNPFFKSNSK